MALQIIGAGFGRTGTLSTQSALNRLGFNCYHMEEVLDRKKNKGHIDFWLKVADSDISVQHDWEDVFNGYTATVDNPGCCVYKQLYQRYPDAKVLVTLHPKGAKAWYKSTLNTIYFSERAWEAKVLILFIPFIKKMTTMTHQLIWTRFYQNSMISEATAVKRYNEHVEEVRTMIPKEKLLIFSVDQGWKPLCDFLKVDIPDEDFPRLNDTKQFRKKIVLYKSVAYVIIILCIFLIVGILYLLI